MALHQHSRSSHHTDADLVSLAQCGDRDAFRLITERCNQRLYRIARAIVRNDFEAEDVVQSAYLRALTGLSGFRGESSILTWLTRITLNEARGRLRARRRTISLNHAVLPVHASVATSSAAEAETPEAHAARAQIRNLIEEAIDRLPSPFRIVFVLREIENCSIRETADLLALTPETVKTRLHRARRLLRIALGGKIDGASAFPFLGGRCRRITAAVLQRLDAPQAARTLTFPGTFCPPLHPMRLGRRARESHAMTSPTRSFACLGAASLAALAACTASPPEAGGGAPGNADIPPHAMSLIQQGRQVFRFDTFGSEAFWGDRLQLHKAIAGEANGGVGPGVSPKTALSVGLKVDAEAIPPDLAQKIKAGEVNLDDPATTIALLKLNAVVGVTAFANPDGSVRSMGIQCAFCHSTVDDSFSPGIGKRLDGWPNRDLNVGAIVSLAPDLSYYTSLLGVDEATVKKVFASWGPGRYDAILDKDGKAFRPDGGQAGTLIPPAYGLAGVNLGTWTGFGSTTYWNAYVGVTQMHGQGTFLDRRFGDPEQYPVSAKSRSGDTRSNPDMVTSKLAALHFYQLSLPAPRPPADVYNAAAAQRGKAVFEGAGRCATCHVPPLFTEPGHNQHAPSEIGVDSVQADRSPTRMYRTAPLAGLWAHQKGGFYHDGRFATLMDVVNHYDNHFKLNLTSSNRADLVEYLKSL